MLNFLQRLFGADDDKNDNSEMSSTDHEGTTVFVVDDADIVEKREFVNSDIAGAGAILSGTRLYGDSETEQVLEEDTRNDAA